MKCSLIIEKRSALLEVSLTFLRLNNVPLRVWLMYVSRGLK